MANYAFIQSTGMLLTGALTTVIVKSQDKVVVDFYDGRPITYYHPAVQSACMFLGECLCLVPYLLGRWRRRRQPSPPLRSPYAGVNRHTVPSPAASAAWLTGASMPDVLHEPLLPHTQQLPPPPPPTPGWFGAAADGGLGPQGPAAQQAAKPPGASMFVFALPTLCDATSTTLMNVGLYHTSASVFQMLRGTVVFFAGLLTIVILKRRLHIHHWQGMMLIMFGAFIVGVSSIFNDAPCPDDPSFPPYPSYPPYPEFPPFGNLESPDGVGNLATPSAGALAGSAAPLLSMAAAGTAAAPGGAEGSNGTRLCAWEGRNPLLGNLFVMAAQLFSALQFVVEEKYVKQYRVPALLAVGLEGLWGVVLSFIMLPVLRNIKGPSGWPLDDALLALRAIRHSGALQAAILTSIVTVAFFNYFGVNVTKQLSGTARLSVDACRTLLVWLFSLLVGWELFDGTQLLGFLVIVCGSVLHNEVLAVFIPAQNDGDVEPGGRGVSYMNGGTHTLMQPGANRGYPTYDHAPALRIGGVLPHPHSLGSMGNLSHSVSSSSDLWDNLSLGPSSHTSTNILRLAAQGVQPPAAGAAGACPASQSARGRSAGGPGLVRGGGNSQVFGSPEKLSNSLRYDAFYSGMDLRHGGSERSGRGHGWGHSHSFAPGTPRYSDTVNSQRRPGGVAGGAAAEAAAAAAAPVPVPLGEVGVEGLGYGPGLDEGGAVGDADVDPQHWPLSSAATNTAEPGLEADEGLEASLAPLVPVRRWTSS